MNVDDKGTKNLWTPKMFINFNKSQQLKKRKPETFAFALTGMSLKK